MRSIFSLIFFLVASLAFSNENAEKTKHPIKVSGTLSLNSNGVAPIPSFSYGKPVFSANLSISKNRFSYDPYLAYGFDLRPWIIDNWFHYKLVDRTKFEMRTGFNMSMFFSEFEEADEFTWQGQRYLTFELAETYNFSETGSLSLLTWYDNGVEPGTISGIYISLMADKTDIKLGRSFLMALNVQAFYIDYTDNNDGFFISPFITVSSVNAPVYAFFQGISPITNNMSPSAEFQWNVGLGISF